MSAAAAAAPISIAERNAANARHSTGPVTAEGKARSSQNALRHGLTGRTAVMPWESEEDYLHLRVAFIRQYQPGTQIEVELLNRMVDCWWKLMRAQRVEAQYLSQRSKALAEGDPTLSEDASLVPLFCDPVESKGFRLFLRYLTNAQRSWRTALNEYQQTRKARIEHENEVAMTAAMLEARRRGYQLDDEEEEEETTPADKPRASEPDDAPAPAAKPAGFVSHKPVEPEARHPFPGVPQPKQYLNNAAKP